MVGDLVIVQLLKHKVGVAGDPLVRQMDYSAGKPRRCVGFGKGVDDMEVALSRAVDEDDTLQEELREAKAFAPESLSTRPLPTALPLTSRSP